ncbi:hypothetical protein DFH28DRAFT_1141596 [Melampsora americana]|nr:hypothetical protein DFH28DRAFT_1141596 [Melampsora americana]
MPQSRIPPDVRLARRRRAIRSKLEDQKTNNLSSLNLNTPQGQSTAAKGKKQTSANKHKGAEKRANPSTPTPLPKVNHPTDRATPTEQHNKVKKAVSHMDPDLTPANRGHESQVPRQGQSNTKTPLAETADDIPETVDENPEGDKASGNKSAKSAAEIHDDAENGKKDEGQGESRAEDEVAVNKDSVIQSLSFKKKSKKEEEDQNLSETQKVRAVKIKEAREQYDEVRAIHDDLCKSIKKLEERAKGGAIDNDHPDVIFVPMVFDPSAPTEARTPIDLGSSPPPTQSTKPPQAVKATKRHQTSVEPEGEKKRRKMRASDYVLDEAKECNAEASKEVLGKRQARRPPYKSPKFVDPEDMEPEGAPEDEGDVVYAEPLGKGKKRGGKEATVEEDELAAVPELFRKALKPDLSKLLKNPTEEEISQMRNFRDCMTSHQFNYGEALAPSVCNVISTWNFDEDTLDDKIDASDLTPHINYMMELIEDNSLMTKRLQTAPRLMQVSAKDPFLNEDSLDWSVIEESTRYPYKLRNGVFRSFHAMLCRTSKSSDWTDDPILKGHVKNGYTILHNILAESVEHISFDSIHDSIVIQTEGDFAVPKQFVSMSQTIGWIFQQISARTRSEGTKRVDRVGTANFKDRRRRHPKSLYLRPSRRILRSSSSSSTRNCLMERSDFGRITTTEPAAAPGTSSQVPSRTIIRSVKPQPLTDVEKKERRQIQNKVNHEASELRREAIQHMGLFFMYGTASFFHVWPVTRDQTLQDAASLVNLASILADRRWAAVEDEKHVYGARAWNRLDDIMYDALKRFVVNGNFRTQIDWPTMTAYFSENFEATRLANIFTLDMLSEIHIPGLSRGLNGLVQEQVDLPEKESWLMNAPATEGRSMYPEADVNRRFVKRPNADSIMASDQAKSNSKGAGRKDGDVDEDNGEAESDADAEDGNDR